MSDDNNDDILRALARATDLLGELLHETRVCNHKFKVLAEVVAAGPTEGARLAKSLGRGLGRGLV